jgi:hypothetical protein
VARLLLALGLLAAFTVFVVPLLLARFVFTPQWLETTVLPPIEKRIGRDISVHDFHLGLATAVVEGFEVAETEAFGADQRFLGIERISLGIDLLSLLRGRVALSRLEVDGLNLVLRRNRRGILNIDELRQRLATTQRAAGPVPDGRPSPTAFLPDKLILRDAEITLPDGLISGIQLSSSAALLSDRHDFSVSLKLASTGLPAFTLTAEGSLHGQGPALKVNIYIPEVDLSGLAKAQRSEEPGKKAAPAKELGPIKTGGLDVDLHLEVGKVRIRTVEVTGLEADLRLADDKLELDRLLAQVAGGQVTLRAKVDLAKVGLAYQGSLSIDDVQLSQMASYSQRPIAAKGQASLSLNLAGRGTRLPEAWEQLEGSGELHIPEATVTGSPFMRAVADITGINGFERFNMKNSGGRFDIRRGRIRTSRMVFGNDSARLLLMGSGGFDTSIDAEAWVGVGPKAQRELLSVGTLMPYMKDDEGWTNIPVAIKGTLAKPKVSIPPRVLAETMIHLIPDATGRILRESGKATDNILKGGADLPVAILREGAKGVKTIFDTLERILEGN